MRWNSIRLLQKIHKRWGQIWRREIAFMHKTVDESYTPGDINRVSFVTLQFAEAPVDVY